jgi:serine phosphatase RsbU (regulator of sigma subunit)
LTAPLATASATPSGVAAPTQRAVVAPPAGGLLRNTRTIAVPAFRFLVLWGIGWGAVGAFTALGITLAQDGLDLGPILLVSLLFAEVVGFTALLSARMVFPLFAHLPYTVNLGLQVLTLFSGTVFGSALILISQPLFSLARLRMIAMIVIINAVLAVVVGLALYTYDSMRRQIEDSYRALREKEAMERELEIAREVQRELLPRTFPEVEGLELAGACHPAVGVGGDYYDFLPFGEQQIGLVIADVSGKGIPAALLMAGLQGSVRSTAVPSVSPSEVNGRLNEMLYRSSSSARYATLFYGLYDARLRTLTYSNAGHLPALHFGAGEPVRLKADGIPLGMFPGYTYGQGRRTLERGDLLALFTDGIIESPNAEGQEFGEARLIELLSNNRQRDLNDIVLMVLQDLARWTGGAPPFDDATIVLARAK